MSCDGWVGEFRLEDGRRKDPVRTARGGRSLRRLQKLYLSTPFVHLSCQSLKTWVETNDGSCTTEASIKLPTLHTTTLRKKTDPAPTDPRPTCQPRAVWVSVAERSLVTQNHQIPTAILLASAVMVQGYGVRQNLVVAAAKTILHSLETSCWKIPLRPHSLRVRRPKPFSAADVSPELSQNAHPLRLRPVAFSSYLRRLRAH